MSSLLILFWKRLFFFLFSCFPSSLQFSFPLVSSPSSSPLIAFFFHPLLQLRTPGVLSHCECPSTHARQREEDSQQPIFRAILEVSVKSLLQVRTWFRGLIGCCLLLVVARQSGRGPADFFTSKRSRTKATSRGRGQGQEEEKEGVVGQDEVPCKEDQRKQERR